MMGWIDNKQAEFVMIVFSNGFQHQYDYFISFNHNDESKNFELEKIEREIYVNFKGEKPRRVTVYRDGSYTEEGEQN